jgi:hypothetical protein
MKKFLSKLVAAFGRKPSGSAGSQIAALCRVAATLAFAFSLQPSAFSGTNASVTFNTNNFILTPTNLWRTNAAGIIDALTNANFSAGTPGAITNNNAAAAVLANNLTVISNIIANNLVSSNNVLVGGQLNITSNVFVYGNENLASNLSVGGLTVTNAVTLSGSFAGNGAGLTNAGPIINVLSNGAAGNGSTDDTAVMQSFLSTPGADIFLGTNSYYLQELTITNGVTIHSQGAHWIYATGVANTNIFVRCMLNSNITLVGSLYLDGGNYSDITTRSFNYYGGSVALNFANATQMTYWNPWGLRHGMQVRADGNNDIKGLVVYGFNGIGVLPVSKFQGVASPAGTQFQSTLGGFTCFTNFMGLFNSANLTSVSPGFQTNWVTNYVPNALVSEYTHFEHLNLHGNAVGMCFSAGNCTLVNSSITANYFNWLDTFGLNDHHGGVGFCDFNHALYWNIFICGTQGTGENIHDCQFRGYATGGTGQAIYLLLAGGFNFDNNQFDSFYFTNSTPVNGSVNSFTHNTYQGTWASQSFSVDSAFYYDQNHSFSIVGDTDGQPLSLLHTNNAAGLTNLNATNIVSHNVVATNFASPVTNKSFINGNPWPMTVYFSVTNASTGNVLPEMNNCYVSNASGAWLYTVTNNIRNPDTLGTGGFVSILYPVTIPPGGGVTVSNWDTNTTVLSGDTGFIAQ